MLYTFFLVELSKQFKNGPVRCHLCCHEHTGSAKKKIVYYNTEFSFVKVCVHFFGGPVCTWQMMLLR
jgi:hypothetical protein